MPSSAKREKVHHGHCLALCTDIALVRQPTMLVQKHQRRANHSSPTLKKPCKSRTRRKLLKQPKKNIVTFILSRRPSALDSSLPSSFQDSSEDVQKKVQKLKKYKSKAAVVGDISGKSRRNILKETRKQGITEVSCENVKETNTQICSVSYPEIQGRKKFIPAKRKMVHGNTQSSILNAKLSTGSNLHKEASTLKAVPSKTRKMTAKHRQYKKRKQNQPSVPLDNISKLKNRVKNALIRMRQEQNLMDAYLGEGWKGHSREKLKPEKELQRAEVQIRKCKLAIREALQELESLGLEGSIQNSNVDSEGRVPYDEIFCSKCHSQEAFLDNDIILCDGPCNRGFHQKCLHPPLATHDIPPEDVGWLCPSCDGKLDCLFMINRYLGTTFQVETNWRELFPEADPCNAVKTQAAEDWPSDDSEDEDYDPDKRDCSTMEGNVEDLGVTSSDETGNSSDSDPSVEELTQSDSDNEGLQALQDVVDEERKLTSMPQNGSLIILDDERKEFRQSSGVKLTNQVILDKEGEVYNSCHVSTKRQRKEVDYKKLNDEIFGKDDMDKEQHSDDEDWGPNKRKRRGKTDISETKDPDGYAKSVPERAELITKSDVDQEACQPISSGVGDFSTLLRHNGDTGGDAKRMKIRMPNDVVARLRGVFAENQLPSKSLKEELSRQLGISYKKVHIWFRNLRYQTLKKGLAKPTKPCTNSCRQKPEGFRKCKSETNNHINQIRHQLSLSKKKPTRGKGIHKDNVILVQKLDAMQLKVEELKRKMENVCKFYLENGQVRGKSGKQIIYLPSVEVVEKLVDT